MKNFIKQILKEELLVESRKEDVFNKYFNEYSRIKSVREPNWERYTMSPTLPFKTLINNIDRELVHNKYLDWLIKTYLQQWEDSNIQPLENHVLLFIEYINDFDKNLDKLKSENFVKYLNNIEDVPLSFLNNESKILNNITDINVYPSFTSLRFIVDEAEHFITPNQKKKIIKQETNKIYEDDDWLVVEPLSKGSSCIYGANTKWCTAGKYDNMFTSYHNKISTLYYIIAKKN